MDINKTDPNKNNRYDNDYEDKWGIAGLDGTLKAMFGSMLYRINEILFKWKSDK